ncbi:MGDG synthase family glycosyltransferase [Acetivibrio straminisolvens]|uniref:MGDG synthase family glycosyltransferase n=1 Tax=Acetivibrio straminisolvens TaxID=253314 RepID=UPI0022405B59|nr:glycosyltransferase [Acetivibrio straminisolvens]
MNVLFLSISLGSGHIKAAEALRNFITLKYPTARTLIVDTFKYINPLIHTAVVDGYLNIVKYAPQIYGGLYRMSEHRKDINKISRVLSNLMAPKIHKLIQSFKPSIIVCTHPFPLQMIAYLKKYYNLDVPSIAIVTDFVNHPFWFQENIEAYIVAHDYIKRDMIECKIPENRIFTYGIPIAPEFLKNTPKVQARKELSLENTLTVLIMGGSLGIGDIERAFKSFAKCKRDIQIIAVAGKNSALEKRLNNLSASFPLPVKIFGYTNNIPKIMDASDFIVTKPGGMTISEALAKKLPALIISPIPGQEERNEQFLINSGAAVRIYKNASIDSILCQIYDNKLRYKQMKEIAGALAKPDSGHNIVNLIEKLINDNEKGLFKYSFNAL